jgi:hypothetical protein
MSSAVTARAFAVSFTLIQAHTFSPYCTDMTPWGGGRFEPGSRRACAQNATNLPVGNADDLNVFDGGVGIEELLNLARVHVLSAADDDVLAPAHDLAEAVLVEH